MTMGNIPFFKMSGSGNDFIIIDNRDRHVTEEHRDRLIRQSCRRKMSTGADGFILIEEDPAGADFKWHFYNADGSRAEMCGNGARCAARFAYLNGIAQREMSFSTDAGTINAVVEANRVRIDMPDPMGLRLDYHLEVGDDTLAISSINTGVPHVIVFQDNLEQTDVVALGRAIRYHEMFAPAGTNANFIAPVAASAIKIRTYERGVEDETLACGTGSVAAALISACKLQMQSPVSVQTRSGADLTIHFQNKDNRFYDIGMEGDARVIYSGELWPEAWEYVLPAIQE